MSPLIDMSVRRLRKIAELNLCEKCYIKYMQLLEPTVNSLQLSEALRDWKDIEHNITQMVRKLRGVFKVSDPLLVSIDADEELPEFLSGKVDVEAFRKIGRWGFERKIRYLHKHGILQEHSYKLTNRVREIRNKLLHDYGYRFTEDELNLISQTRAIVSMINWAVMVLSKEDTVEAYKVNAEKAAEELLSRSLL